MSLLDMFRGRGYERLSETDSEQYSHEDQLLSTQYETPRRTFPKREIVWGTVMLVLGIVLVGLGVLIHFEHWENRVPGLPLSVLFWNGIVVR